MEFRCRSTWLREVVQGALVTRPIVDRTLGGRSSLNIGANRSSLRFGALIFKVTIALLPGSMKHLKNEDDGGIPFCF